MQVLRAVDDGWIKEPLRQKALEYAWHSPQPTVRDLFDRFLPDEKRVATLGMSPDPKKILALQGDAARGSQLLAPQGKLAACFACHLVNGAGHEFGPDLSKVAARLQPDQILESLLQPSKVIAPGYQAVSVETNDGAMQVGFVVKEDAQDLSLKTATGQTLAIAQSSIKKRSNLPASLMPEGLLQSFTAQEAADLLAFLNSLR
jgi:putative heme-binding domain-containing protein